MLLLSTTGISILWTIIRSPHSILLNGSGEQEVEGTVYALVESCIAERERNPLKIQGLATLAKFLGIQWSRAFQDIPLK